MTYRDMFQTQPCNRCGGCGRYSWNQKDGDRCYGCNGTGLQYTKAGAAALAQYRQATVIDVNPADVQVGWWVSLGSTAVQTVHDFICVQSIRHDDLNGGQFHFQGKRSGIVVYDNSTCLRRLSADQRRAIYNDMQARGVPGVTDYDWS